MNGTNAVIITWNDKFSIVYALKNVQINSEHSVEKRVEIYEGEDMKLSSEDAERVVSLINTIKAKNDFPY